MVDVRDPLELFSESDIANLLAKELRQNLRRYRQNPHPRGILLAGQPAFQRQMQQGGMTLG